METNSQHFLVEFFDCNIEALHNQELLEKLLNNAALAANVTIVKSVFHQFSPQGITGVVIIEESHLSLHTWPEYGYASVDFYTCGDGEPNNAYNVLLEGLEAKRSEVLIIDRGLSLTSSAMKVRQHDSRAHLPRAITKSNK